MVKKGVRKILIYIFLLIIVLGVFVWWLNDDWAKGRDYRRLADMKILQAELAGFYGQFNTYKIPECQPGSAVNLCAGRNGRVVKTDGLIDPINKSPFQYTINELADDNFSIGFVLETAVAGLSAGRHILTKNGISK